MEGTREEPTNIQEMLVSLGMLPVTLAHWLKSRWFLGSHLEGFEEPPNVFDDIICLFTFSRMTRTWSLLFHSPSLLNKT